MIDVRPILALLDLNESRDYAGRRDCLATQEQIETAIVEIVKAANLELERIVRELLKIDASDSVRLYGITEQMIARVLAKPVDVPRRTGCGHDAIDPVTGAER